MEVCFVFFFKEFQYTLKSVKELSLRFSIINNLFLYSSAIAHLNNYSTSLADNNNNFLHPIFFHKQKLIINTRVVMD